MSKVGGLGVHEVGGGVILICILNISGIDLLVVNTFFMTTSNFGGAQTPLIKKWGGSSPPAPPPPPRFSASVTDGARGASRNHTQQLPAS